MVEALPLEAGFGAFSPTGLEHAPFAEMALLLGLAALVGFVGLTARQPLIVSFIAVGILAGPSALNLVRSGEQIATLAELGIAVLLFLVGLKLDPGLVRSLGRVAVVTGLGQVAFTSLFGFLIALALGFPPVASLYIAVALTFSSTIIIVKLLADKRELDTLHGQIALGFLIVQDLVVVLAMITLSAIGAGQGGGADIARVAATGLALVGGVLLFARLVAGPLTQRLATAPEMLLIAAIALAALMAALADAVGLGKELGGLLAGVALASSPWRETIAARLAPLRDFLLLFFFIALGAGLDLAQLGAYVPAALVFSLFVLIGNPLIVLVLMGALGYSRRTGFLAGLTVAQISEFSLIFVGLGVTLGHVASPVLGLVTLVGLITIAASTYLITWSHPLYARLEPWLRRFERRRLRAEERAPPAQRGGGHDVLLLGLGRFGSAIAERLAGRGRKVLAVDFSPEAVRQGRARGLNAIPGDATDPEFLSHLPLDGVEWLVMTMPMDTPGLHGPDPRLTLVQFARLSGWKGRVAVAAHSSAEAERLRAQGVDLVLQPFFDAADQAVDLLTSQALSPAP